MSTNFGSRWYVAQTQPHAEAKASLHLRRQGFSIYLPRYLKQRRHARRIDEIAAPLFPRYLFVAVDLATQPWLSIDSTFGVSRLVRHGERPAPISEHVIEALCDCAGLYEGMSSHERVAILLELLGRKVRVVLDNAVVEAA
jgi:transcriptional antiterminator RfaH